MQDVTVALSGLLKDTSRACYNDPSSPSVILSWLPKEKQWYGALVRYEKPFGKGRITLVSVKAETLAEVVEKLRRGAPKPTPPRPLEVAPVQEPEITDDDIPF